MTTLKRTPIYDRHVALGGKIVPFAGWEMPVEYTGILDEHAAVRNAAGIFDVSHMGEIEIRGKRALEFCQRVSSNDASALKPGKVQYSCIPNETGCIVDDCTLYRLSDESFLFVVNASRKEEVVKWFRAHTFEKAEILDRSDEFGLLAIQGKKAESLLSETVRRDLTTVGYYEFIWTEVCGAPALISRTGYTGEDGFEMYVPWEKTAEIWDLLMEKGKSVGLKAIGLGARDTLRLEMGYMLYGNDIDLTTTPLEAGLQWIVKLDKGNFLGRDALLAQKEQGLSRRMRAFRMTGRSIPRPHYEIFAGGKKAGSVTSGTFSPTLKAGIALGYVDSGIGIGSEVAVRIRNRDEAAQVVKAPFVTGSVKK